MASHPLLKMLQSRGALPGLSANWRSRYLQLTYKNRPVGWINKNLNGILAQYPQHFQTTDTNEVALKATSQAEINHLVKSLYDKKVFTGWRGENYAARARDGAQETLFTVERASARVFGLVRHAVHVNGYVNESGELKYWMGKRSSTKSRYPNMLDNVVAGGLPVELSPLECAVKECWEEASIDESVARKRLKCTGSITRCCEEDGFLSLEEIFIFDLDMEGVVPTPKDGEVESFSLVSCREIMEKLVPQVKPDVLIVLVDFLVRNGLVEFESDPVGYLELVRAMHDPLPGHISSKHRASL